MSKLHIFHTMNSAVMKRASQVAQWIKNLPARQETQVRSLAWKIPWKRKWQPTPVLLPGESHGQEEPGEQQSMGLQRSRI